MSYTIMSGGRAIGTTELGFVRIWGPLRSGWFLPNPEGERLMPRITAMHAAFQADAISREAPAEPGPLPELDGRSPHADVLEALHHVDALDLTLHHPDGTLIPTQMVALQDTQQLLAWIPLCEARDARRPWTPERDRADAEIDEAMEHDLAVIEEIRAELDGLEGDADELALEWDDLDDAPPPPGERYQVFVMLESPDAIA